MPAPLILSIGEIKKNYLPNAVSTRVKVLLGTVVVGTVLLGTTVGTCLLRLFGLISLRKGLSTLWPIFPMVCSIPGCGAPKVGTTKQSRAIAN